VGRWPAGAKLGPLTFTGIKATHPSYQLRTLQTTKGKMRADLTATMAVFIRHGVRMLSPDEISDQLPAYPAVS
jgi:hypothetical protein